VTDHAELTLEGLGDWRRTRTCGELTRRHASQQATMMGWVHRSRDAISGSSTAAAASG